MNPQDAISANELDRAEWVPTYYCERCGRELGYPPVTGRCDECDEEVENAP